MTVWFISRHVGAIEWIKRQNNWQIDRFIEHLNLDDIQAGDKVLGTLPISIIADICAKGAEFWFLEIPLSADLRGKEISLEQMKALDCQLTLYYAEKRSET